MRIPTRSRRLLALVLLPILAGALPFHLRLEKSDPAEGSTVATPAAIQLWFSQKTELTATRLVLRGARGDTIATGPLTRGAEEKAPVRAPVIGAMADGAYTVDWRTMAADGHVVRGSFGFTVKAAAR